MDQGLGPERLRRSAEGAVSPGGQRQRGEGTVGALLSRGSALSFPCSFSSPRPAGEEGFSGPRDVAWLQRQPLQRQSGVVRVALQ